MKMSRKTSKTIIVTALCTAFSTSAYAGAESGLYLGGGLGHSSLEFSELGESYSIDDNGFKAILGYNFGILPLLDLGLEGSYVDFGESSDGSAKASATAWDGFGLVGLSLGPFGLFGKMGLAAWDSKKSVGKFSFNESGTDPVYGIGARLQIAKISVRAEYEYFDFDRYTDVSFTSLSLLYTF